MSLHRDELEARCAFSFTDSPIYLNIANSVWQTTDSAATIIESELLADRVLATTVTCTYNTVTNVMEFEVAGPITTPVNTSLTFNRIIVLKDPLSQVVWTGTETTATDFTVGNPNPFAIGDRIIYNGTAYILDNVVGQVITVNSGPFTQGLNEVRDGTGLIVVASVLSAAETTFIPANSSITVSVTGQSLSGT